jgi:two-component system response regulator
MSKVLFIEDNDDDLELARRVFEKLGVAGNVHFVRDGSDALDYIFGRGTYDRQEGPSSLQLILLDLNLPKIPGLDVLRQIRSNPVTSQIPIVVLTVSRKEPDLLQSFSMGIRVKAV